MKTFFYGIIGRISTCLDRVYYKVASPINKDGEFDRTGIVAGDSRPLNVFNHGNVVWAEYDSISMSLWRAQELSLLKQHLGERQRPVADIGCGDGSFASALFKEIDYGVDHDPLALSAARQYGIYKTLVKNTAAIESGSVRTVYSNSVLEHVKELETLLSEISRIMAPGGVFAFTVPVVKFKEDLTKYFGAWYSEFINNISSHYNVFPPAKWKDIVEPFGFKIVLVKHYQPSRVTYLYVMLRFLGEKGLGRLLPGIGKKVFRRYADKFFDIVRSSVDETADGANIFVLAVKKQGKTL